jgi:hypothetical protein
MQIRIRITDELGKALVSLPPRMRARVVSLILATHGQGVDLRELSQIHRDLGLLRHLLQRSLEVSRGGAVDSLAVERCIELLQGLTDKSK